MEKTAEPSTNPLATEKIGKLILKFSIPAIISLLVNAVYNIEDQILIGQGGIGLLGIAATNVAFPLATISTAVALLLGVGGASNFSLSLGSGEKEKAGHIAGNSLLLMTLIGMVIAALSIAFLRPLLIFFGATEPVMPYAMSYTFITCLGIPFAIFSTAACHLIRADGGPSYAMMCMVSGALFNVIFDPIFLFVFHMGIAGFAWTSTLGQVLSSALALRYILRKFKSVPLKKTHLRPQAGIVKAICSLGVASCFNQLAITVVQIALNNTLRHYGAQSAYGSEIPLASVGAISKVTFVFMAFAIGIAQGCQPINGFNYGAKNYGRVKQTFKTALVCVTAVSIIVFFVFQLFPRQIAGIFGSGNELYFAFATRYIRIYLFMTFINGIQPVTANFFTSIGKAKVGFFISLTRQILFLLPLILILPLFLGIDGVMYAGPVSDVAAASLAAAFIIRQMREITCAHKAGKEGRLSGAPS